ALCNLGVALARQEKHDEAAECFLGALDANPDESRAFHGLTHSLIHTGRTEELLDFLREALRHNANSAETHHALWLGLAARREWDEAVRSYGRALELRPEFAEASCNLGN